MKKVILICLLILGLLQAKAQDKGFVIRGTVPSLPDGTVVSIGLVEDSITEEAVDTVRSGKFELRGKVSHPMLAMLSTNNLSLIAKNNLPEDSIHWNYIDLFLSNDEIVIDRELNVHGGRVQDDFVRLCSLGDFRNDSVQWHFIERNPQSVVSAYLVNNMLKRGYSLSSVEVERLSKALTGVPEDSVRWNEYQWRVQNAKLSTVGSPLIDLEITDVNNKITQLSKVVPHNSKFVLIDFWASWCGQCLMAFPELEELGKKYKDDFVIIDLSIDTKEDAWQLSMKRHPQPWPQYRTTANGYKDLFKKYQIGNGVPYFVMIAPDGKVMKSPKNVEEIRELLKLYLHR